MEEILSLRCLLVPVTQHVKTLTLSIQTRWDYLNDILFVTCHQLQIKQDHNKNMLSFEKWAAAKIRVFGGQSVT